jgi:hypothetical protein
VITTRLPVADIADHEGASALRLDLEQLSGEAGAKLLRALGVKGHETELRHASDQFDGHCLALTLLGSYLTDAYNGDIHCREEVSARLVDDTRQGAHARKVMESYQSWLGEGPELSVLRLLGLFDRPADEKALGVLLKSPAIPGLTESLTNMHPMAWRTVLAKLRRARFLAGEDPHNPGQLDTHPLVREYFGEQLRSQRAEAWIEWNRRLFINYYRTLSPRLPESFREMEPLFLSVISGCNGRQARKRAEYSTSRAPAEQNSAAPRQRRAQQHSTHSTHKRQAIARKIVDGKRRRDHSAAPLEDVHCKHRHSHHERCMFPQTKRRAVVRNASSRKRMRRRRARIRTLSRIS